MSRDLSIDMINYDSSNTSKYYSPHMVGLYTIRGVKYRLGSTATHPYVTALTLTVF